MNMDFDIAIIGAGITGASLAFALSKYDLKIVLLDGENDVSMKTTKANSGIIHAGYDPLPGTRMARFNLEGSKIIHDLAPKLGFHYKQIGSLVIGKSEEDHSRINALFLRGRQNGVEGLSILKTEDEVRKMEPRIAPGIDYALYAPSAAIVSPWELCLSLAETAVLNGVRFVGDCKVSGIQKYEDGFSLKTSQGVITASYVLNAAGVKADEIYRMVLQDRENESFTVLPVKGEYFLMDKELGGLARHVIFQTPTKAGKGVLVSPTVHGNLLVGPNADSSCSKEDVGTSLKALSFIGEASRKTMENIPFYQKNIRNFAGIRATLKDQDDFLIEESPIVKHFFNFAGIKSPGLSSGPAIGLEGVRLLDKAGLPLHEKKNFRYYHLPKFFKEMTEEEKIDIISRNPDYGQIICRCETVTKGEILESLKGPIPARSIDGVKRRTNAGMGRCQSSFCGPKVFGLIQETFHLPYDRVNQDKTGSQVVLSKTKEEK
jgi:glycerol-3-phosphate dehydrogenase